MKFVPEKPLVISIALTLKSKEMFEITVAMHSNTISGLRSIDFKIEGSNFDLNTSYETNCMVNEHCSMNSFSSRVLEAIPSLINTSKNGSLKQ